LIALRLTFLIWGDQGTPTPKICLLSARNAPAQIFV
jgi:hypothetical protein